MLPEITFTDTILSALCLAVQQVEIVKKEVLWAVVMEGKYTQAVKELSQFVVDSGDPCEFWGILAGGDLEHPEAVVRIARDDLKGRWHNGRDNL